MDVNENTEADVAFEDPVAAIDPDNGAALTYSLSGADPNVFAPSSPPVSSRRRRR